MGKYSHLWDRSRDNADREERSLVRWVIGSTVVFLLIICVFKKDNVFKWISVCMTVRQQEEQMDTYRKEIKEMDKFIGGLENSKDTLEMYAREKFNFAKSGEDVYVDKK